MPRVEFENGVRQALAYILMDPRFLYRFEHEPQKVTQGQPFRINDIDLASRLSFFIWSSIPDEELLQAAAGHRLSEPGEIERQVKRMLADPKASALADNFASQWLQLRQLASAQPQGRSSTTTCERRSRKKPGSCSAASCAKIAAFSSCWMRTTRSSTSGWRATTGSKVSRAISSAASLLPKDSPRRGLLGKGAVLTVTSVANRTSPVIRGAWVLENVLGVPPSPPPPGVENNLDVAAAKPTTLRARLAQHRADKVCASCHNMMDPIGLALENYDYIGKWRTLDSGLPIDTSGVMVDGTHLAGSADLRNALLSHSATISSKPSSRSS